MRIVLAPNALKGSLTAEAAAQAMERGVRKVLPTAEIISLPVADGGDGAGALLGRLLGAEPVAVTATGPLGDPVTAPLYYNAEKRLAVMEMAAVAGLALLEPAAYDPLHATTRGVGELIRAALALGAERLIIGIGGSATTDGGIGMAHALGARFYDAGGCSLQPEDAILAEIRRVDASGLDARLRGLDIQVICDVDNPLLGERGAAQVYAPQKGATPAQVERLESGLKNLADVLVRDLSLDVRDVPGAGAAGGLGAGLMAFLGAQLYRGVEVMLDALGLDGALQGADLVITAEGRVDAQTLHGKAPAGVAARAQRQGVPCLLLAGSVEGDVAALRERGVTAVRRINPAQVSLREAMAKAADYLEVATERAVRDFCAGLFSS
jgi:glycerate kinase